MFANFMSKKTILIKSIFSKAKLKYIIHHFCQDNSNPNVGW